MNDRDLENLLWELGVDPGELARTPQDPTWHAEGDVWIHTRMVVAALEASPAWRALAADARAIVFLGALLHDIGKPATTRHEDGRITSRGHSRRGELLARRLLWDKDVPFGVREHACALIRHHQVPFFGITRPPLEQVRTAARLSLRLRHDWLALVADADARGRTAADRETLLDHTALWVEHCREHGCLDRPFAFPTAHTRVATLETEEATRDPRFPVHDDTESHVIVMAGMPASGTDAWLAHHHPELPVVSLDAIRESRAIDPDAPQGTVVAAAREAAREHLRARRAFAWNATNLSERVRGQVIALCRAYRARVQIVYCEAPAAELRERNAARAEPVPQAAIERMLDHWTVPALDEAHEVTYVVGDPGPVVWPP